MNIIIVLKKLAFQEYHAGMSPETNDRLGVALRKGWVGYSSTVPTLVYTLIMLHIVVLVSSVDSRGHIFALEFCSYYLQVITINYCFL